MDLLKYLENSAYHYLRIFEKNDIVKETHKKLHRFLNTEEIIYVKLFKHIFNKWNFYFYILFTENYPKIDIIIRCYKKKFF